MSLSNDEGSSADGVPPFDSIKDELPYVQLLNKVLPPDIRILAWCPSPPPGFSARFNCTERRYRYFFTNPAYVPSPAGAKSFEEGRGWLNIKAMQVAAKKYEGLHDFQNFCKVDPSKQITNFARRIFHAGVHEVSPTPGSLVVPQTSVNGESATVQTGVPRLYYFEVRGSAFLWHQVRHLIAVLFLVGQGWESPSIVDQLLDIETNVGKPMYEMASDVPLVLWDCIFPTSDELPNVDHAASQDNNSSSGYKDALDWHYVGDELGGSNSPKPARSVIEYGKYDRNGIMDDVWALWHQRKLDEVLAASLMDVVVQQGQGAETASKETGVELSDRVFDGSDKARTVGTYVPLMQRARLESPEVVNARYAVHKLLTLATPPPISLVEVIFSTVTVSGSVDDFIKHLHQTYRKHNHDILLSLHHNTQVKPDLEPLERLVDENILDAARRNEPGRARPQVTWAGSTRLHAQSTNDKQRFRRVASPENQPGDAAANQQAPDPRAMLGDSVSTKIPARIRRRTTMMLRAWLAMVRLFGRLDTVYRTVVGEGRLMVSIVDQMVEVLLSSWTHKIMTCTLADPKRQLPIRGEVVGKSRDAVPVMDFTVTI
nr:putative trna pseudouridine synthase c25b8.05 [Quercus suber]